ncbi:MAG: hypothetical protein KGL54_11520 [Sphingomonadales bacterium]|nr:hypothetical protein [Sphingomonadales bacterium]
MGIVRKATLTKIVGASVLAATAITSATPAMADPYYGHRRGGDTTGAAIAGGIIGIALGAIIASSASSHRNDRYVDRGWTWRDGYYWDRQGRRYDRDGRPCDDRDGYYERRGYGDRGWGDRGWGDRGYSRDDRGYYGRDPYYGDQRYRYGN